MNKEKFEEAFETLFQPMIQKEVSKALEEKKGSAIKNPEQWLTIGKACKEFGCTPFSLRNAMVKQELSHYPLENRTYIKRIDVHNYLETIRIKAVDDAEEYQFLKHK